MLISMRNFFVLNIIVGDAAAKNFLTKTLGVLVLSISRIKKFGQAFFNKIHETTTKLAFMFCFYCQQIL
jgi:hypothetical protein